MRLIFAIILLSQLGFGVSGEKIFEDKCLSCHSNYIPQSKLLSNFEDHNNTILNLKAPTINQLSFALKHKIGDRKNDAEAQQFEIENFLIDYLAKPSREKSILSYKINHFFDKMPSIQLSDEEIEALSIYLYDYVQDIITKHGIEIHSYQKALEIAKKEKKIIVIYGYLPYCGYCIKMNRRVMVDDKVKKVFNQDFIMTKINLAIEKLPLNMQRMMSPSFYFIDSDGKTIIDKVEGYGTADEFIELLEMVKGNRE